MKNPMHKKSLTEELDSFKAKVIKEISNLVKLSFDKDVDLTDDIFKIALRSEQTVEKLLIRVTEDSPLELLTDDGEHVTYLDGLTVEDLVYIYELLEAEVENLGYSTHLRSMKDSENILKQYNKADVEGWNIGIKQPQQVCKIRKDILDKNLSIPIGDNMLLKPTKDVFEYRWINEDSEEEQFQIKIFGSDWVDAESIDFEF